MEPTTVRLMRFGHLVSIYFVLNCQLELEEKFKIVTY